MTSINEMPFYDLRRIKSVEEARDISDINEVAVLIYPEDAEGELGRALRAIQVSEIGTTIYLPYGVEVKVFNGICELEDKDFITPTAYLVNGVCTVRNISPTTGGTVIVNGILVRGKSGLGNLNVPCINGRRIDVDFEATLTFDNKVTLSARFLEYMRPKTLVIAGNKIEIDHSVTEELLLSSGVYLIASNKIVCSEKLLPCLQCNCATVGNKFETD